MKKNDRGYMTVEATISLTAFLFFMMFIMNMGTIYQTQNYVVHGLTQTGKFLSYKNYEYKNRNDFENTYIIFAKSFGSFGSDMISDNQIELAWEKEQYAQAVKNSFAFCAGKSKADTEKSLKKLGLEKGIDSIDFSKTDKTENKIDLLIDAKYEIKLPFAFFGLDKVTLHNQICCRLWG